MGPFLITHLSGIHKVCIRPRNSFEKYLKTKMRKLEKKRTFLNGKFSKLIICEAVVYYTERRGGGQVTRSDSSLNLLVFIEILRREEGWHVCVCGFHFPIPFPLGKVKRLTFITAFSFISSWQLMNPSMSNIHITHSLPSHPIPSHPWDWDFSYLLARNR